MKHLQYIIYPLLSITILLTLYGCTKIFIGDEGKLEEDIYLNYQTKTNLELPFDGKWFVFNGGRTHENGAHHFITWGSGQRYAIDVLIKVDGKTHTGSGTKNEDYYCFGKPLYAPGYGIIVETENSIEDNVPGELNENAIVGNYVMIDHLNGEYSLLAHFKKGSVIVSVGDTVAMGQELGQTGNSGNSTEAHLHYHMQNSPKLLNSTGLPAKYRNYYADDIFIAEGEPIRGQLISK